MKATAALTPGNAPAYSVLCSEVELLRSELERIAAELEVQLASDSPPK